MKIVVLLWIMLLIVLVSPIRKEPVKCVYNFFEQLLCNKKENGGDVVNEIIDYLLKEYGLDKIELNPIGKYWLIDLSNLE